MTTNYMYIQSTCEEACEDHHVSRTPLGHGWLAFLACG